MSSLPTLGAIHTWSTRLGDAWHLALARRRQIPLPPRSLGVEVGHCCQPLTPTGIAPDRAVELVAGRRAEPDGVRERLLAGAHEVDEAVSAPSSWTAGRVRPSRCR